MYSSLDKQEDWTPTCMTLLECMIQIPEEDLLLWQDGAMIARLKLQKLQGTLDVNTPDVIYMIERICKCIRGRHGELRQSSPSPKTRPQTGYGTRNAPAADPKTHQHSHSRDDSEDASVITGLSSDKSSTSSLDVCNKDEAAIPKLKKKSVPRRAGGKGESFVWLWLK